MNDNTKKILIDVAISLGIIIGVIGIALISMKLIIFGIIFLIVYGMVSISRS